MKPFLVVLFFVLRSGDAGSAGLQRDFSGTSTQALRFLGPRESCEAGLQGSTIAGRQDCRKLYKGSDTPWAVGRANLRKYVFLIPLVWYLIFLLLLLVFL